MDDQISAESQGLLQIGGGKRVVHGQERAGLVSQLRNRRNVQDLQKRIGRRLDPDQLGGRRDDASKPSGTRIFRVTSDQSP